MGNRAVVIFVDEETNYISPAVYLHWNGGAESVYRFLDELDRRKVRSGQGYDCARFIQIVGEAFDRDGVSGISLGVSAPPVSLSLEDVQMLNPGDNGIYLVYRTGGRDCPTRRKVRRIGEHCDSGKIPVFQPYEMSAQAVAEEKGRAYADDYEGLATWLGRSTGDKEIHDNRHSQPVAHQ